jgi:CxxC motif-containing protein
MENDNLTEDEAINLIKFNDDNISDDNMSKRWLNYQNFPDKFKNDVEFNIRLIIETGIPLHFLKYQKNNKKVVMASITSNPNNLMFASEELKNDKEIIQHTIKESALCIEYASEEIKDDKDIMFDCVSRLGSSLEYASDRLKNDKKVVMRAILNYPSSIEYVSEELKNDIEIMLIAVKDNAENLCYASESLQNNKKLVLTAFENSNRATYYVGSELRKEIGKNNPIAYLKSALLHEELNRDIVNPKQENKAKLKL